jgi:acyl transferase domain-containing protein
LVSNVTGALADPDQLRTPEYWVRHIREAVRFHDGVKALYQLGVTRYFELGPDATLTALAADTLAEQAEAAAQAPATMLAPTLTRDRPEPLAVLGTLAQAHVHGLSPDWSTVLPAADDAESPAVELPTYAFQRRAYWLRALGAQDTADDGADDLSLFARLAGMDEAEQLEQVKDLLRRHAAAVLGYGSADEVYDDSDFVELGFSSFTVLELCTNLQARTGLSVNPVAFYDHPTLTDLARFILAGLADGTTADIAIASSLSAA